MPGYPFFPRPASKSRGARIVLSVSRETTSPSLPSNFSSSSARSIFAPNGFRRFWSSRRSTCFSSGRTIATASAWTCRRIESFAVSFIIPLIHGDVFSRLLDNSGDDFPEPGAEQPCARGVEMPVAAEFLRELVDGNAALRAETDLDAVLELIKKHADPHPPHAHRVRCKIVCLDFGRPGRAKHFLRAYQIGELAVVGGLQ